MKFYIGHSGALVFAEEVQEGLTNRLRQKLRSRLGTQLGRRPFRPDYGLDLREFLMRNLTGADRARLRQRIRNGLADLNPASVVVSPADGSNILSVIVIL